MTVRTKSPTSAVSPPVEKIEIPLSRRFCKTSSVPFIIADRTSAGIKFLFRPIVEDNKIFSIAPTQIKSSKFIITAS